jgi:hypothetical protein
LKDLVLRDERAHIILVAKLTDGLTIREAAEVTGLSFHQLIRTRNQLLDFDLQNIVLRVVKFI